MADPRPTLFLVVCAASPARHVGALIARLHSIGWWVRVYATADGAGWLDPVEIGQLTGGRLRLSYADLPNAGITAPDLVLVAPATFNTINHLTAGLNNSLALSVVQDAVGSGVPVMVAPHVNQVLAAHPLYQRSIHVLRSVGVHLVGHDTACPGGCDAETHWPAVIAAVSPFTTHAGPAVLTAQPKPQPAPVWVIAGPPGAGKTTVARHLAGMLNPPGALLDKDDLFGDFVAATLTAAGRPPGQREGPWYDQNIKPHEYSGMAAAARTVRQAGCPVVLVARYTPYQQDLNLWNQLVAQVGGGPVRMLWVHCDPVTLRSRLVARASPRDGQKLANFTEFLDAVCPDRPPLVPHTVVDNSHDTASLVAQITAIVHQ